MGQSIELVMIVVQVRKKYILILLRLRKLNQDQNQKQKRSSFYSKLQTKRFKKDIYKEISRIVRVSICIVRINMPRVKDQHLIFKTRIAGMKIHLLVDNENKIKLIDKCFVHTNKIPSFKLEVLITFIPKNSKVVPKTHQKGFY